MCEHSRRLEYWPNEEANGDGGQTVSLTGAIIVVDVWYALSFTTELEERRLESMLIRPVGIDRLHGQQHNQSRLVLC